MAENKVKTIRFSRLESLSAGTVRTFVTTREGGVSAGPYASLNLSFSSGDTKPNVIENRRRLADSLEVEQHAVISARQVHGAAVWDVKPDDLTPREADILVTNQSGLALMVLSADCVPLVMSDPKRHVVAVVHAGRRGTIAGAAQKAVEYLVEQYRCSAKEVLVGIGPAIAAAHYEIAEVDVALVRQAFPDTADQVQILTKTRPGFARLDLVRANQLQIERVGILPEHIDTLNLDTFTLAEQFYSARRQKPFGCIGTGIILN